jgi:K+-transporting ATPase ATPase C chain
VTRIAKVRGMTQEEIRRLISQNTDSPDLGFLGEPGVNVLTLNLALDAAGSSSAAKPVATGSVENH